LLGAQRGLSYNLGLFIHPQADTGLIGHYKQHFQSGPTQEKPCAIVTMSVFCADSEEQALALQLTSNINLFRFFTGQSNGRSLTPQEPQSYAVGPQEKAFIAGR
jgi:alkanesulfonate monooxygenase SsuD/methylene tetrahydromethanopterin reductase-like flavin-dependent oxidoreductase (luciferase family)